MLFGYSGGMGSSSSCISSSSSSNGGGRNFSSFCQIRLQLLAYNPVFYILNIEVWCHPFEVYEESLYDTGLPLVRI